MEKHFILTIEQIHEKLGIKTEINDWTLAILLACHLRRNIDFIEIDKKMYFTKRAANKMWIHNDAIAMRQSGKNEVEVKKFIETKKNELKTNKKMEIIVDQFLEKGENPYTCTELCKMIGWDKDPRSIARQLHAVFGQPNHTRINGVQGKYYYLKLKE
jgi:hypothetical protein